MIEERRALPERIVVQEGDHRALEVVQQRRELFDERRARNRVTRQVPFRLVEDRPETLFAAQVEDVPKLRVHLVALGVRQIEPRGEQLVRLGLPHRHEIQIAEQPPPLEIAGEQGVRHLPEEIPG